MGLPEGHAEKEGVEVTIDSLVSELKNRLAKKSEGAVTSLSQQLQGTSV
jgi:histidyl-tRNA synthetase